MGYFTISSVAETLHTLPKSEMEIPLFFFQSFPKELTLINCRKQMEDMEKHVEMYKDQYPLKNYAK